MNWAKGQQLQNGKYVIEKELGRGGFGITYKAQHTFLNYDVVIKTPNEDVKSDPDYPKYVDRFIKEGQMLAQLSNDPNPHIVRISDLFQEGQWLSYSEITFDLNAPQGHLPRAWAGRGENLILMGTVLEIEFVGWGIAECVSSLCSRVETCKL
jgi:serine/threonine-protein kinase